MDRNQARWLFREETRGLIRGYRRVKDGILDAINAEAENYLWRNRRIDGAALKAMAVSLDKLIVNSLAPARRHFDYRRPTIARPKSDAYELRYVFAHVLNEEAQTDKTLTMVGLRIHASRKRIEVNWTPLGVSFYEHAGRRALERKGILPAEKTSSAFAEVLDQNAFLLRIWAMPEVVKHYNGRVAIPLRDGLLIGITTPMHNQEDDGFRVVLTSHMPEGSMCAKPEIFGGPTITDHIRIKTFVGREYLRPSQRRLVDELHQWNERYSEDLLAQSDTLLFPDVVPAVNSTPAGAIAYALEDLMKILQEPYSYQSVGLAREDWSARWHRQNTMSADQDLDPSKPMSAF